MCKKLFLLISLVLLLALAGNSLADADPTLVAYYTLDGDANDTGNVAPATDGVLHGNPIWTTGRVGLGGSIDLDGVGDFVQIPDADKFDITESITIAFWMKVDNFGADYQMIVTKVGDWKFEKNGTGSSILFVVETEPHCAWGTVAVDDGKWHHIAGVRDGATDDQILYVDGVKDVNIGGSIGDIPTNNNHIFISDVKQGEYIDGGFDDLRIYNRALSASEIWDLYNVPHLMADYPDPNTGEAGVSGSVVLSWTKGDNAVRHDVYLGTDETAVADATTASDEYIDRRDANSYDPDPDLASGKTYYWRIDEVNSAGVPEWPGWVWSFVIASCYPTNPSPADGYQYALLDEELTWTAGYGATLHRIRFGTVSPPPNVTGDFDTSYDPGPLEPNETYYWQIIAFGGPEGTKIGPEWNFRTTNGLRGWWKFDDGSGTTPADSSGNNNYAVFGVSPNSLPTWTDSGRIDGALEFNGDEDWVEVVHDPNFDIPKSITVTVWIKINDFGGYDQSIIGKFHNWKFEREHEDGTVLWCVEGGWPYTTYSEESIDDGEWHHLAGTYDGATGDQCLYVDGELDEWATDTPHPIPTSTNPLYIGSNGLDCVIDDLRVYDYNLSEEVIVSMASIPWLIAHNANPANKSTVATDADGLLTLSWAGGTEATSHDVYFGTDFNDVNEATTPTSPSQSETSYPVGPLETEKDYYWRIDELGAPGGPYKGDIWRFTTAKYFLVDDFESYASDEALLLVWSEYAYAYLGQSPDDPVHGGAQSMKFAYRTKDWPYYCAVRRTYSSAQDWSADNSNVKALTLWFRGESTNDPEQMYVELEDAATKSAQVAYGDVDVLQNKDWQQWNIDLQAFVTANDVNLANIKSISIGFGDGESPGVGGGNFVYFDDIQLHPSRCVPEFAEADFTNDCIVDLNDLDIMTGDWLLSEYNVNAVTPNDANLVALYEFENNLNDTSSNGHHGDPCGEPTYAEGKVGDWAVKLDGDDYVVITDSNTLGSPFDINDVITVACWIKVTEFDERWQAIVTKGDNSWRMGRADDADAEVGVDGVEFACSGLSPYTWVSGDIRVDDGQWHHVAGVYDGSKLCIYVDGILDFLEYTSGSINNNTHNVLIGANEQEPGREWNGLIDELRIYNRALPHGEIISLAEKGPSVLQPLLNEDIDLHKDGEVNFKDYVVLAENWLEMVLWP